jgi:hypothetical protein
VSLRRNVRPGVGLNAELAYDWIGVTLGGDAICVLDSHGACKPDFPPVGGFEGLLGVSVDAGGVAEFRVNAGRAAYSVDNTRLGAPTGAIEVATTPHSWLGVIIGAHSFVLPNYRNDRVWGTNWQLGLRLRSHP